MTQSKHPTDPAASGRAFMDEGDIGSGEKTPAQQETEEMIKEIPPLQPGSERDNSKRNDAGQPKQ
ncbi:MAG: hypothetical protein JWP72_3995 [Massilia sp.]|nr:hypothetical protein [Massilia sp.]MDB5790604.1 hypothetical protein [Massilia sp.]